MNNGNENISEPASRDPLAAKRPPEIRHAFLKRVLLLLIAIVVNLAGPFLILAAIGAFIYIFFLPSSGAGIHILRQVIALIILGICIEPVFHGLITAGADDGIGLEVDEKEQQALFRALKETAAAVGTSPVKHVAFRPEAGLSIDLGSSWFNLRHRPPKLYIGLPAVIGLTAHEFKTGLAHEHAHLRFGRKWSGLFIRSAMVQISSVFAGFMSHKFIMISRFINPIYWLFWIFAFLIGPWGEEIMKWDEYQADIAAGRIYGSMAVIESQRKGILNVFAFELAFEKLKHWLKERKTRVDDIITYTNRIRESMDDTDVRQILARNEVLIGRFDSSHPSPAARAEMVEEFECKVGIDDTPAMDIFQNVDELRRELTDNLFMVLTKKEKIDFSAVEKVSADELPLSYTGAELDNILDKFINEAGGKGLNLVYDRESLERADRHFAAHPEFFRVARDKDIIGDLILYFGETIRRLHGGEWVFPIVAPPRLKDVGPDKRSLELFEIFLSELASSNYPSVMPAYIRSLERLGIREDPPSRSQTSSHSPMV